MSQTPDSLVKFCDAASAEKILAQKALRWSAPHLFSDPLELDYTSRLTFSHTELLSASVKKAVQMIFSLDNPVGNTSLVQAIRRWRVEERFDDPEETEGVLNG